MQNLGSDHKIELPTNTIEESTFHPTIFGFAADIHQIFRFSTRIISEIYNITFAGEIEYSVASYGQLTQYARAVNTKPAELIRCTIGTYYFF